MVNSFLLSVKWEPEDRNDDGKSPSCKQNLKIFAYDLRLENLDSNLTIRLQIFLLKSIILSKFQILTEKEDDAYTDFSAQWTMSTASSVLTLCFLIEVIMKMIAFTPYGKSLLHFGYKYQYLFKSQYEEWIKLCVSFFSSKI